MATPRSGKDALPDALLPHDCCETLRNRCLCVVLRCTYCFCYLSEVQESNLRRLFAITLQYSRLVFYMLIPKSSHANVGDLPLVQLLMNWQAYRTVLP